MSLHELCEMSRGCNFIEIVLYYDPTKEEIKPYLHPLGERLLTYDEWLECTALVTSWYLSVDREEIARHNAKLGNPLARPFPKREATKERQRHGFIYVIKGDRYCKIGQAVDVPTRIEQFSPALPFPVEIIHTFATDDMNAAENELHERFADKRTGGEWFALSEEDIQWLKTK